MEPDVEGVERTFIDNVRVNWLGLALVVGLVILAAAALFVLARRRS